MSDDEISSEQGTPSCGDERAALQEGDAVTLYDLRRRRYSAILREGKVSDLRGVKIPHNEIIGRASGCRVFSAKREPAWAFAATLSEFSLSMTRSATIIYPKDAAYLVYHGELYPGMRVLEAGLGSGALSIALLRAIGPTGQLVSYERRSPAIDQAKKNIERFLGPDQPHQVIEADIYSGLDAIKTEGRFDRIFLDLAEPWRLIDDAAALLHDGGLFLVYLPTVLQVHQHMMAARAHADFFVSDAVELLERGWHIAETSARPAHQMVGHTGFICISRRIARPS